MTEINIHLPRKTFDVIIHEHFSDGITGIFGPSGAGKTSLLHAISGLETPAEGKIIIEGQPVFDSKQKTNLPVEKRNIGYVFQEGRLFPHMSIEKNLLYGFKKNGHNKVVFNEVVELLQLEHLLQRRPSQISGGERQRAALGRSLLSSPDILLLDEPFSAVDVNLREQILPYIISVQKKVNIPILVVSHDLEDLLKLSNTLFIIRRGKCLGHGDYYDLLKEKSISDLFGSKALINSIPMTVVECNAQKGLTRLAWRQKDHEVLINSSRNKRSFTKGQEIKIFIHADDIALSLERLPNITIQNQVKGRVTDILPRENSLLCIIDAGFKLVVEITADSQQRMNIQVGSPVWCLFKSVAIDVVG